jgi:hypothetical protein
MAQCIEMREACLQGYVGCVSFVGQKLISNKKQVTQLVDLVREAGANETLEGRALLRKASGILYTLSKVRGFKTVVKFFPHEVVDLEPCLKLLATQDPTDHEVKNEKICINFATPCMSLWQEIRSLLPAMKVWHMTVCHNIQTWETRYVLLLWLSILVMVPFSLETIDSMLAQADEAAVQVSAACLVLVMSARLVPVWFGE